MKFTKMQGCGNDYIYVNCFSEIVPEPSALAARISDRHYGVGGDGLILIEPSDRADAFMHMFNVTAQKERCAATASAVLRNISMTMGLFRGSAALSAWIPAPASGRSHFR